MGGHSGGGGSSGKIDYPDYMKDRHAVLYDKEKEAVEGAIANNPYVGMQAWSPECMYDKMGVLVDFFDYNIGSFDPGALWNALMESVPPKVLSVMDNPAIDDYLKAQKDKSRRKLEDEILPKFRRGMQDLGAVMTSAFKIGEALLWARELVAGSDLEAEMRGKLALAAFDQVFKQTDDILQLTMQKLNLYQALAQLGVEAERYGYVAYKEYTEAQNELSVKEVNWALDEYKYMQDCLGSIAGSAGVSTKASEGNRLTSALGGAASGVALGAMTAGPPGAVVGGILGGVAGLFG